jgi:glycine/D-amino acid oxidase-like deaminating enzyme/nitrite reductase/ring-hydroxylating ferredoxin subunit
MSTRSHSAPWGAPVEFKSAAIDREIEVDVCVVGAGIAGLSVAYHLARERMRVVVIDDGAIGGGMTMMTSAHLASVIDDRFVEVEKIRGEDGARLAAESHSEAIDTIETICKREEIECDFERVDGYLFGPPGESTEQLEAEEAAARRAGLTVERVPRAPLESFDTGLALRFAEQAEFQPLLYLRGLAEAVERYEGRIVTGVHVSSIEDGEVCRVETTDGHVVVCDAVVVATNSPINDLVTMHNKQFPYLTYVIGLEVPRGSVTRALYWDTEDPYHYVRIVSRDDSDLLVVGGEDHKTGQENDGAARLDRLEVWARERFPQAGRRVHQWAGQVMETFDGLGFIGKNPGNQRVFIATGDSGMGLTHGTIAGILITDLIAGRSHRWEELYDPSRKPVTSLGALGEFVSEAMNTAGQYLDRITPGEVDSEEEIAPGTGAVVRRGVSKLAVYRDEAGDLHEYSAICPHLKAVVAWNDVSKTWDCPAHGSRFDCHGVVCQGPANVDLAERAAGD